MATESGFEGPAVDLAVEPPGSLAVEAAASVASRDERRSTHAYFLVEEALREEPTHFPFMQMVRLLSKLRPGRARVGRFVDPEQEVARFAVNPSVSFAASEVQELDLAEDAPARVTVNFMGLTGQLGVLPYNYSLLVVERRRAKDYALGDFFDLFHHRMLSLFYRAWEKHRFTIAQEEGRGDHLAEHLLDLVGFGLEAQHGLFATPDLALAYYAGLLGPLPRGALALEQLLEDYFRVPAQVEQFVGGWYRLPPHDQCELGEQRLGSTQLGLGAVAGDEIYDRQARVRVRLGPLTREQFDDFLPTGAAHEALRSLVKMYSHDQFDFELQLVLARDEVPGCALGSDEDAPTPLGWATWIRSAPFHRNADETVLTL